MTGATTIPEAPAARSERLFAPERLPTHGRTLEDSVLAAWRELRLRGTASCVVCGSQLGADGACPDCGSELS